MFKSWVKIFPFFVIEILCKSKLEYFQNLEIKVYQPFKNIKIGIIDK